MAKQISKERANEILHGTTSMRGEPIVSLEDYNHTLSSCLNWYNINYSSSDYKKAVLEYAATLDIKINAGIPEYAFRGIGAVCRLILRNCTLRSDDIQRTIDKIYFIQSEYEKHKLVEIKDNVIPIKPIVTQIDQIVIDYYNMVEDDLMQGILDGKIPYLSLESMVSNFAKNEYSKTQAKLITDFIESHIKYYSIVITDKKGSCEQAKEAWSHIPLIRIKTVVNTLKSLLIDIDKTQTKIKVAKSISKKELSPILQTKDVVYLKEYQNFKGLSPTECINSSEIWFYSTDTREINVIRALAGLKFTAKGTTFQNVDVDNSFKKKLRNPDEQLQAFINPLESKTKKYFKQTFNAIKTTETKTTGRMSDARIIIQIFN